MSTAESTQSAAAIPAAPCAPAPPAVPSVGNVPVRLPDAKYSHLFHVPLVTYVWPESGAFNEQLRARVLAHAARDRGVQVTNVGGWRSADGQLEFLGELREALLQRMSLIVNEATLRLMEGQGVGPTALRWSVSAWANIYDTGGFTTTHTHPGSTWSGMYYVDAGESRGQHDGAKLCFVDPALGSAASFLPLIAPVAPEIAPVAGLMVLFPSYLPHSVLPHRGSRQRISIAFNFRNEPYP